jgi:ribosomal protein S18 acetylase RimI-like enzyme
MLTGVMHIEVLWVDEEIRGHGHGKDLMQRAERIGKEKGYTASHTWTFSFQAPEFYQAIGYEIIGVFDGYPNNITEYVLMKRLEEDHQSTSEVDDQSERMANDGCTISEDCSEESLRIIRKGMGAYTRMYDREVREEYPRVESKLVIKDGDLRVIGGIQTETILGVLYINHFWIEEAYRCRGYGRDLLMEAERVAREAGCISGLASALSFQSPGFFQRLGYEVFGVSDGYPGEILEYHMIKRY